MRELMEKLSFGKTLGRRAAASKHWEYMPGMEIMRGEDGRMGRVVTHPLEGRVSVIVLELRGYAQSMVDVANIIPNVFDDATLGCLLSLVRQATHKPRLCPRFDGELWMVEAHPGPHGMHYWQASSEPEALVRALEEAP